MESSKRQKVEEEKEDKNLKQYIEIISVTFESIIQSNLENKLQADSSWNPFQSEKRPTISIQDYLMRFCDTLPGFFSESHCIMMLIYIDRLIHKKGCILTEYNIHRLMAAALLVAMKFHEDVYYSNKVIAKIAGVSVKELNDIETEFCFKIGFNLNVSFEDFKKYKDECDRQVILHSQSDNTEAKNVDTQEQDKGGQCDGEGTSPGRRPR